MYLKEITGFAPAVFEAIGMKWVRGGSPHKCLWYGMVLDDSLHVLLL